MHMNVLVIGANGKTGKRVVQQLCKSTGHKVRAMIRDEKQASGLQRLGAETVVADLEKEIGHAFEEMDAVIFAAGSGSHTGPEKTETVDHLGAVQSVDEAEAHGLRRYVMLSSLFADDPDKGPASIHHYLVAKGKADGHLMASRLPYTVVRPGALTDDAGVGTIRAAQKLEKPSGRISRDDVAAALIACLSLPETEGKAIEILDGETGIEKALRSV